MGIEVAAPRPRSKMDFDREETMKKIAYFSYPMHGIKGPIERWWVATLAGILAKSNIYCYRPMRERIVSHHDPFKIMAAPVIVNNKLHPVGDDTLSCIESHQMDDNGGIVSRQIVAHDTMVIKRAAIVIADLHTPSAGVSMEIMTACSFGVPVVGVLKDKSQRVSPWILAHLSSLFLGPTDVIRFQNEILSIINREQDTFVDI